MKGKLIFLLTMMSQQAIGVQGQDFASRFMHEVQKDTTIRCETISPKMLETLIKTKEEEKEKTKSLISKLKSVRIINAPKRSVSYFQKAETLLENNKNRFQEISEDRNDGTKKIFLRKKDDVILELVLLNLDSLQNKLTIVNLTGEMDNDFIQELSENEGL